MKRQLIYKIIISVAAMALIIVLMVALGPDSNSKTESAYLSELGFAMQRMEELEAEFEEGNYRVLVAHLYSAAEYAELANLDSQIKLYELWNLAAVYPEELCAEIDALLPVFGDMKSDGEFKNTEALRELSDIVSRIKAEAAN